MSFWLGNETVNFSGMKGDLDSQGTAASVSSGSFPMTSSLFWLNGGTASASGLTSYSEDFSGSAPSVGTSLATARLPWARPPSRAIWPVSRDRNRARQHERFGERPECHHHWIDARCRHVQ